MDSNWGSDNFSCRRNDLEIGYYNDLIGSEYSYLNALN